jgi:hypothetical protein
MASNKLPVTGTTITMGRVRNAFNLAGAAALSGTLGANRQNERAVDGANENAANAGTTALSASFGNRPTKGPVY